MKSIAFYNFLKMLIMLNVKILYSMLLSIHIIVLSAIGTIAHAQAIDLNISSQYAHNENNYIVKISFEIPNNYYAYAHEQIDSGKPTILKIFKKQFDNIIYEIKYPKGQIQKDIFDPNKNIYAYTGKTSIFVVLAKNSNNKEYDFILEALLCSKAHCIPLSNKIKVIIPNTTENIADVNWYEQFKQAKPSLNNQFIAANNLYADNIKTLPTIPLNGSPLTSSPLNIENTKTENADSNSHLSMPLTNSNLNASDAKLAAMPTAKSSSESISKPNSETISSPTANPSSNPVKQITPLQQTWAFSPQYAYNYLEVLGLGKAMLLGLLAGLILNFMPCVLPVLTIKASAFLLIKDEDKKIQYAKFREHSLLFAAGIITLFIILAIVLSSAGLMWGQLFQKAQFVLIMLSIVFLLGLSMLGVFILPMLDLKASSSSNPRLQAYTSGILTTLLATPCSAPLLGGVLGWAFTQPSSTIVIVFISVGCGMSLPYFLFALKPQLIKYLPKPGAWIGILEKIVGFFLLATSIYLLSILPEYYYIPTLILLLAIAFSAWIYGKFASYSASTKQRRYVSISSLAIIAITAFLAFGSIGGTSEWEDFNPATFKQIIGKERILLGFTADWCPNCKLLDKTTLTSKNLKKWQKKYNLRLIRVDLSQENIAGQELLKALGSHSIPLTAIFPKGKLSSKPIVLRDIYSYSLINDSLSKAFSGANEN